MKFVDEYRHEEAAKKYASAIARTVTKPWMIMEVCGGQTHAIVKFGLDKLLPREVTLVHGPGCPVCVTPIEMIDTAIGIASLPDVIFCSFGDMLRVPGTEKDLITIKSLGGDVRTIYDPLETLKIAHHNPRKQVVFFAVGFETTTPATALTIYTAREQNLSNFSALVAHVRVPPAMELILASEDNRVQGFLAAGHVATVMGLAEYEPLARKYKVPIVVTGFEPLDILQGLYMCIKQLEEGRAEVENQYQRSVRREGNTPAQKLVSEIFQAEPRHWRGIGEIPASGLGLAERYAPFDAAHRFEIAARPAAPNKAGSECVSGLILQGIRKPHECAAFATSCSPEHPLGATMVSSEGACAAYYHYANSGARQG